MERYNPFARSLADDPDPFLTGPAAGLGSGSTSRLASAAASTASPTTRSLSTQATPTKIGRYTTSFPDPFGDLDDSDEASRPATKPTPAPAPVGPSASTGAPAARSNSVTFAPTSSRSIDESPGAGASTFVRQQRQTSGLGSFLNRATSVTSSTVTDRVSGAVGSMRSAVDSLSSNLNESLSSTAGNLMGALGVSDSSAQVSQSQSQSQSQTQQQQQQSAASYLASKFASPSQSPSTMPVISRQRVILVLDDPNSTQWAHQFNLYRRLTAGPSSAQSALTSFFSSATAQLTSSNLTGAATSSSASLTGAATNSAGSANMSDGADCLVEQADFRDVSVIANQSTATATILVNQWPAGVPSGRLKNTRPKIVRPEYVVVKQRTKDLDQLQHLRSIVTALNYSLVPIFEPMEVWSIFQDRQLLFAKLLRLQRLLGKENFSLVPQVFCQTHQCLMNYINSSSSVPIPCLVRTGTTGKAKIRAESMAMLKAFASIVAGQDVCCTLEPLLEVKYDLIVQKLGTSLKLFKRLASQQQQQQQQQQQANDGDTGNDYTGARQPAARQTSIGSSVFSSLISSTTGSNQQQLARRSSNNHDSAGFEKMAEVNARYRQWVEAIGREFDNKLEAFCLKIVVTTQDREYIVGLNDCSMDFIGGQEHQDEDRRSFVELIISNMNTVLPKTSNLSRQPSDSLARTTSNTMGIGRRSSGEEKQQLLNIAAESVTSSSAIQQESALRDKKKFNSQTQINGGHTRASGSNYGQLSSRSQSVSVNQLDHFGSGAQDSQINKLSFFNRRGSDNASNDQLDDSSSYCPQTTATTTANSRQASLSQSLFDQTSTAFSSFQKQSISFFKRLDSRADDMASTNTPPLSAKSDQAFDRSDAKRNGFKSQSVDCSALDDDDSSAGAGRLSGRPRPPKPPPPKNLAQRPHLVTFYSTKRASSDVTPQTSQQTSQTSGDEQKATTSARVIRQNSALSAFEPYDPEVALQLRTQRKDSASSSQQQQPAPKAFDVTKRSSNFDSASITSGDSNSTSNETTTAEDTMNNLKKTFASIFGDKCE